MENIDGPAASAFRGAGVGSGSGSAGASRVAQALVSRDDAFQGVIGAGMLRAAVRESVGMTRFDQPSVRGLCLPWRGRGRKAEHAARFVGMHRRREAGARFCRGPRIVAGRSHRNLRPDGRRAPPVSCRHIDERIERLVEPVQAGTAARGELQYNPPAHGRAPIRVTDRVLRDSGAPRGRRNGRGLSLARHEAQTRGGHQGPARGVLPRSRAPCDASAAKRSSWRRINHPHVAQIYGIEEIPSTESPHADGAFCLVLELVEGETLA